MTSISSFFASRGCTRPDLGLLQPADPFLDMAGEDLRRRIFITADQSGANLCLRPEFTIPACLYHLRVGTSVARYAYEGPVFRQRSNDTHEFRQAGVEDFGAQDQEAADARAVGDAIAALRHAGETELTLVLGDQSIFEAVIQGLDLPEIWMKRLTRNFGDPALLAADLKRLSGEGIDLSHLPDELSKSLDAGDRAAVVEQVTDTMRHAGLPFSGVRTPDEIVCRLFQKHELSRTRLSAEKRSKLETYLQIDVPVEEAVEQLKTFADQNGVWLGAALTSLERRLAAMATHTTNVPSRYKASFGRRLDYYTGMVFECYGPTADTQADKPLAGGGRYNKLLSMLGSNEAIPAVGFSVWLDRVSTTEKASKGEAQ